MTRTPAIVQRAINRARGHMRGAESEAYGPAKAFSVSKAAHIVNVESLKLQARQVEATEMRALIAMMDSDPELLSIPSEICDLAALKIQEWARGVVADEEDSNGDD